MRFYKSIDRGVIMICKNCGRPLESNVQFCGFCGTQVEEQVKNKPFEEKKNKKLNNGTKIALLMMLLAFCILGVSVFIFVSRTQKTTLKTNETTQKTVSNQSATANSQVTYNSNIGETLQIAIPDNIIATEPQANTDDNKTNYDKYGKYIGKNRAFALNDYPNAEEQPNEFAGADGQLKITNSVYLVYGALNKACNLYLCYATDIYPNIASGKSRMTKEEFEDYLGVSTEFITREENANNGSELDTASLCYSHNGYNITVFCEDDGSIIFDKTVFWVNKQTEPETEQQTENSSNVVQTNFDKCGKYLGKPIQNVYDDFPDAEPARQYPTGKNHYGVYVSKNSYFVYDSTDQICKTYNCWVNEIYPDIEENYNSMTIEEFEDYLGEPLQQGDHTLNFNYYFHQYGYKIIIHYNGTDLLRSGAAFEISKED